MQYLLKAASSSADTSTQTRNLGVDTDTKQEEVQETAREAREASSYIGKEADYRTFLFCFAIAILYRIPVAVLLQPEKDATLDFVIAFDDPNERRLFTYLVDRAYMNYASKEHQYEFEKEFSYLEKDMFAVAKREEAAQTEERQKRAKKRGRDGEEGFSMDSQNTGIFRSLAQMVLKYEIEKIDVAKPDKDSKPQLFVRREAHPGPCGLL